MNQLQMKLAHSEKSTQAVSDTLSEKQKEVSLLFIYDIKKRKEGGRILQSLWSNCNINE